MALGTSSFNSDNSELVFLNPRSKDKAGNKVKPYFQVGRKGADGKIVNSDGDVTEVTGDLFRIEVKERTFNDSVTKHVYLCLRDRTVKDGAGEAYLIDLTFRNASRSLFNRLFSLETPENLTIGIFENQKGYETFYLRQNDEKVSWKFELESLPEPTMKRVNGKNVNDYEEVDSFFEKELLELAARLNVLPKKSTASSTPAVAATAPAVDSTPATTVRAKSTKSKAQVEEPAAAAAAAATTGNLPKLPF